MQNTSKKDFLNKHQDNATLCYNPGNYFLANCNYCINKNANPLLLQHIANYEIETNDPNKIQDIDPFLKEVYKKLEPWLIRTESYSNIYYACEYCILEFKEISENIDYNIIEYPFGLYEKYFGYYCNLM